MAKRQLALDYYEIHVKIYFEMITLYIITFVYQFFLCVIHEEQELSSVFARALQAKLLISHSWNKIQMSSFLKLF